MEKNELNKMLRDKEKYLSSTPKFSTRKQAFKAGWKAGFEYAKNPTPAPNEQQKDEKMGNAITVCGNFMSDDLTAMNCIYCGQHVSNHKL